MSQEPLETPRFSPPTPGPRRLSQPPLTLVTYLTNTVSFPYT